MKTTNLGAYTIPALTLGTVGLGISYGVFEGQQQPDVQAGTGLIARAIEEGITAFDTAREYGRAEALLANITSDERVAVISKFKITKEAVNDKTLAMEQAYQSVKESLQVLNISRLPVCLFHMVSDYDLDAVCAVIPEVLRSLEQDGLIAYGGISADNLTELKRFAALSSVRVLQIPVNIFDQRLQEDPVWEQLSRNHTIVFARSVFLKGLLLRHPDELKGNLKKAAVYLEALRSFADEAGMSVAQFCFAYVRDMKGITSIVFGADNEAQLMQNIGFLDSAPIPEAVLKRATAYFSTVPEAILIPRSWKI
ncbi:aldo/keto reductase [Niabella pedocola]|uniref:Aldo/keto reductase n=1 Tax=Niabella pedocola TaxID=1752077 RepID=A0ABS8PRP1_9BACT|nr:aldo/keto reductase [Niabella pedocola]MCD2422541.1 aldo/keto reductase [Niabella pedocola]